MMYVPYISELLQQQNVMVFPLDEVMAEHSVNTAWSTTSCQV